MTQHHSRTWIGGGLGIIALALGLLACGRMLATDAYTALEIKQAQVLSGSDCNVPGSPSSVYKPEGILDLALPDNSAPPYYLPVVVANNMDPVGGTAATEMNNITLTHFTVELSAASVQWSSSCPAVFDTTKFSYLLAPGTTTGASFNAITQSHSRCILPYVPAEGLVVTAKIRAKGRHGGTSVESAPFIFPVTICKGCLQQGYNDPVLVAYEYPANYPDCAGLTSSNTYSGSKCLPPGQDETILCCGLTTSTGIRVLCPAVFTGSTSTSTTTAAGP
jgi:hypothetical protein